MTSVIMDIEVLEDKSVCWLRWQQVEKRYAWLKDIDDDFARMELKALLLGLDAMVKPARITVKMRTTYLICTINHRFYKQWPAAGWVNSRGKPVAHADLWRQIVAITAEKHLELAAERKG